MDKVAIVWHIEVWMICLFTKMISQSTNQPQFTKHGAGYVALLNHDGFFRDSSSVLEMF